MGLASALSNQGSAHGAQQPAVQGWLGVPGSAPYPPAPQQQFAPPPAAPSPPGGMAGVVAAKLAKIVQVNQLSAFYPPDRLHALSARVAQTVDFHALAARWRMPVELAVDLASLALYDIVIYGDDSGSMESGDGERIDDLKLIVAKVAEVATLFDDDGIEVRFINTNVQGNHVKTAEDASRLLRSLEYRWDTKLATQMQAKILEPMAYNKRMNKPLLIITITDGEPSDKPMDKIVSVIQDCVTRMTRQGYGPHGVAFQFAQVGRDKEAQEFLAYLDRHPQVGKMIDCTSYFELEQAEYAAKGVHLSVEAWLVKLMVGAIDPEYDEQDEAPGGQVPPQPGYCPQPSGSYPQVPGGYQQPYQQQPAGYPPMQSGGYGQPMTGYPQQHAPYAPQGGGGYPSPGSYPSQTGTSVPPAGYPGAQQQQQQQAQKPKKGFFGKLFS